MAASVEAPGSPPGCIAHHVAARGSQFLYEALMQVDATHHRHAHAGRVGLRKPIGDVVAKMLLPIRIGV
jgi:hypothetical protein